MYIKHSPARITIKGYRHDDCTINAIGTALGLSYDLSRKILQTGIYYNGEFTFVKSKPRTKKQFTQKYHVKRMCNALSIDKYVYISDDLIIKHKQKKSYPKTNFTLAKFAEDNQVGIFLILTRNHLASVIDGKIVDTWNSSSKTIEIAYKVDIEHSREVIKELAKYYKMNSSNHILSEHTKNILRKGCDV
ncbi:MAG TPA: hypothetical protein GXZ90_01210 [Clostridiales bacterium]|nr:hypothetical protein [Clostridiales bacterium]